MAQLSTADGLARLTPMNLMPERYSHHMQTVTKLKQIHNALVSSANGSYTIDVYTPSHSTSHIPTSFKAATKIQHLDAHMDKKYSDFMNLRDKLYKICKESHSTMGCSFCSDVAHTLLLGAVLPGSVMSLVLSKHQQTKAVQRFIDSLLQLAASCPIVDSDACPCQKQLPQLLLLSSLGNLTQWLEDCVFGKTFNLLVFPTYYDCSTAQDLPGVALCPSTAS